jgi:hypothetical protein
MESLEGIDRMMMSGRRATLVLESGAILNQAAVEAAIEDNGLVFESMEQMDVPAPGAVFVAKTPKFT